MNQQCCTSIFRRGRHTPLCTMFRFSCGEPEIHGQELAAFLKNTQVVSEAVPGHPAKYAAGAECLAAQMVAHFKDGPGEIYLTDAWTANVQYEYLVVIDSDGTIELRIHDESYDLVFEGSPEDFFERMKEWRKPVHV